MHSSIFNFESFNQLQLIQFSIQDKLFDQMFLARIIQLNSTKTILSYVFTLIYSMIILLMHLVYFAC